MLKVGLLAVRERLLEVLEDPVHVLLDGDRVVDVDDAAAQHLVRVALGSGAAGDPIAR